MTGATFDDGDSHYDEVVVRSPVQADDSAIVQLLAELGYDVPTGQLEAPLRDLSTSSSDAVLVAYDRDIVVGLIAVHWSMMLQHAAPTGRITTLVVASSARGRGVGRILVEAGARIAAQAGCKTLKLTTALHRTKAHEFYEAMGFKSSSLRFSRSLQP